MDRLWTVSRFTKRMAILVQPVGLAGSVYLSLSEHSYMKQKSIPELYLWALILACPSLNLRVEMLRIWRWLLGHFELLAICWTHSSLTFQSLSEIEKSLSPSYSRETLLVPV